MIDPAVWLPSAAGTMWSATAAAEPADEPPGVCARLCGLRVLPGVSSASSVVTVLPRMTAPALRRAATHVASRSGRRPLKMGEPFSVGISAVSKMSLTPIGTPCSAPEASPAAKAASASRACARASSGSRCSHACTSPSRAAMRSRQALTSATEVSSPRRMASAAAVAESDVGSAMRGRLILSDSLSGPIEASAAGPCGKAATGPHCMVSTSLSGRAQYAQSPCRRLDGPSFSYL